MLRLYAIEASPTLTGASADHRFSVPPGETGRVLRALAAELGAGPQEWRSLATQSWIAPLARDLAAHRGRALVHLGPEQPPELHAIGHLLNDALGATGATVELVDPIGSPGPADERALAELVGDMDAGRVDTLLILGSNPAYTAPADLPFADAMKRVGFTLALAAHRDETASAALWHAPEAHALETWGDARSFDGTATIVQPQARPLHGGRTALEILGVFSRDLATDPRALVREHWRTRGLGDDAAWTAALRSGVVPGSAAAPVGGLRPRAGLAASLPAPADAASLTLLFRPDPFLRDGRFAANGWLQELPRPLTRLTWGNAALIAPATAEALALADGDVVRIATGGRALEAPVWILPGHAADCATLPLGFGRTAGAGIGDGVGVDANRLRAAGAAWAAAGATLTKTGRHRDLATVQHHQTMEGRDIVRVATLDELRLNPKQDVGGSPQASLYPPHDYSGAPAWAMAIDLNACIGCGACVAACQAENNVPVVGEEEVLRGRQMHWLRVDRYWSGGLDEPDALFQPVLCMHCEKAPCEVVCPVQATTHDAMGLNVMVYNRCVGTRFCSNNCPYKVRRFNYFDYTGRESRPAAARNPDVTVRSRGVMEKCTYCLQRIMEARIAADREGRPIRDGEVTTACQAACPTRAFTFGDLTDKESAVVRAKADPRNYDLLAELNTRPRTSYAARVRNPNPEIAET
jgi:molybdopterin-containing oxidoreductase family iron-sulfur binding subunit